MALAMNGLFPLLVCTVISRIPAELSFSTNPVNLQERTPAGTVLSQAYDPAVKGSRNAYSIINHLDEFRIDPYLGSITNKKVFDYERDDRIYELTVESATLLYSNRKRLIINITDVAEAPECTEPQFVMGTASITIDENFPALQSIYRVEATDDDLVNGDKLHYTIYKQISAPKKEGILFHVDPETGTVSWNSTQPLDYDEGYHTFQLELRVTDTTGQFCLGRLTVKIRDLNDEKPEFVQLPSDSLNVTEKKVVGDVITTVKALDRDKNSNITYAFAMSQTVFSLDPKIGTITLLEPLDSDTNKYVRVYPLQIEAVDDGNTHTASYTVTVFVEDVNDNPVCDPSFSTGQGISVSVPESFPAATAVYTILARDPDPGEAIEFSILNSSLNTMVYFLLDTTNGGIYRMAESALDYEKDPKMIVAAKEKGKASPGSCTGTITIMLQDVNDESPIFMNKSRSHVNMSENLPFGTVLARLIAEDKDVKDRVHYEFVESYRGFSINAETGEITTTYPLDYEDPMLPHTRVLEIRAFDSDRQHSATAWLHITLEDENDNLPRCTKHLYVIEYPETIPVDTTVVTLACEDRDGTAANNRLVYNLILDDFSKETFSITDNVIKIGPKPLNYDSETFAAMQFKHTLIVKVSDSGVPSLTSTVTIVMKVTRVNEIYPHTGTNIFHVLENSKIGTAVGRVNFTDEDWPFNNLKYSLIGDSMGNPPRFYIEPNTGIIKVFSNIDRETKSQYDLWVKALDLDNDIDPNPSRQKSTVVLVKVNILNEPSSVWAGKAISGADRQILSNGPLNEAVCNNRRPLGYSLENQSTNVNDEPPVCSPPYVDKVIYSTIKTPILQLNCKDKDSPAHQLSYTIVGGNAHNQFQLQRSGSGPPSLMTTQNFQYDAFQDPTTFQLLIEVADDLNVTISHHLSTTTTITIHVIPWSTTKPSSTTKATTAITTSVLIRTLYYWHPEKWFPAILTVTAALLLMSLYMASWACFKDIPKCGILFPRCCSDQRHPLVLNAEKLAISSRTVTPMLDEPKSVTNFRLLPANLNTSIIYDGRALDPVTGEQYLFNSKTGDTQWIKRKTSPE